MERISTGNNVGTSTGNKEMTSSVNKEMTSNVNKEDERIPVTIRRPASKTQ